jgi:hypothetical protein
VEDHGWLAARIAAELPIDEVAAADVQQAAVEGLDFRIRRHLFVFSLVTSVADECLGDPRCGRSR